MQLQPGFVGLGLMGTPMARRLLKQVGSLAITNRTREKAAPLLSEGAVWYDTPADVAAHTDTVFSMLSDPAALRSVALGPSGILAGLPEGGTHVDTSTVSPQISLELATTYRDRGRRFLHAPVLGSVPHATEGTLLMFVGGDDEAYNLADPYLKILSQRQWRFPRAEQASSLKLICNLFITGMITTLGEAMVFAEKSEVDQRVVLDIIGLSQLSAPMYATKGASIIGRNFAPRFFLEHMLKDINLMIDAAGDIGTRLPGIEAAQTLFREAERRGLGREDYSAVVKVLQEPERNKAHG